MMDNPLTPRRIQKLIYMAEGRPYMLETFLEEETRFSTPAPINMAQSPAVPVTEASSGIIDLDNVEGFGDSGCIPNMSTKSSERKMENRLTPNRIQKLINLAEGTPFNIEKLLFPDGDRNFVTPSSANSQQATAAAKYESSSGVMDMDNIEDFEEYGNMEKRSISKLSTFNPGEMTGRSTGTSEAPLPADTYGRHSLALASLTSQMDKQTSEIQDLMRHSIATNYSFHSKRDLTADEASFIAREAPLPVMNSTRTYFEPSSVSTCNVSVGAYFKKRCDDFGKILGNSDSPDRSCLMPSITEVSTYQQYNDSNMSKVDDTLDSIPVRQPRSTNRSNIPEKQQPRPKQSDKFAKPNKPEKQMQKPEKPIQKHEKQMQDKLDSARNVPDKDINKSVNPASLAQKSFMSSYRPTDVLLKNLLHSSLKPMAEDPEASVENSISISRIADYLGNNQSNISVTDILKLNQSRAAPKHPLTELNMNRQKSNPEIVVTNLIDSKKGETASSAGTINTVISLEKLVLQEDKVPKVVVTEDNAVEQRSARSKSPSTKSPSTLSTVRDNYSSFKSADSPSSGPGEANRSKVPSPNIAYKELDKSVDWQEILFQKRNRQRGTFKEHWVDTKADLVEGFVGASTPVTIKVTTLSDSWLTAKFQIDSSPNMEKILNVELPRLPLLLSPGKTEDFTFHLTSNVEMNTVLPFTFFVKDTSIDGEIEHKGDLKVNFKMPNIQAMSADGVNKLSFPPIQEKTSIKKTFVLISDCPADLQIMMSITEGDSLFSIKSVQEIRKSDVNKVLLECQGPDEQVSAKSKVKVMNKQLCRLVNGKAIRVTITFNAPKLSELKIPELSASFKGVLNVTLISGSTVLRKVDLTATVGIAELEVEGADDKIRVTRDQSELRVKNTGTVSGNWKVTCKLLEDGTFPLSIVPPKFDIPPGETRLLQVAFVGDEYAELPIRFEDTLSGNITEVIFAGGLDTNRPFPIKSNYTTLSWVRAGRKEISLKNNFDKKVYIRVTIVGDGFSVDLPGAEARGIYGMTFNAFECRPLPLAFIPSSCTPYTASLHMVYEKETQQSKKIRLFGVQAGEPVRWTGLVTYSDTAALVRACSGAPVDLRVHNKSTMPAFVAARVHFNLQYMQLQASSRLTGACRVVPARSQHSISLRLDWARVERRAREARTSALASVTVLSGAECTRLRILKILKSESDGQLDTSMLPEHLKVLARQFEGEDKNMENFLTDFNETKASLNELIGGLQELTAHIDLPHDFADEVPIIMNDTTVLDHHTICD